jgi:hypothetical protein
VCNLIISVLSAFNSSPDLRLSLSYSLKIWSNESGNTVKLGYNELGYNELPVITNKFSPFFQSQNPYLHY